jgi:hypothetical protein
MARGHIRPILPMSSSSGIVVGIIELFRIASCSCFGVFMWFGNICFDFIFVLFALGMVVVVGGELCSPIFGFINF